MNNRKNIIVTGAAGFIGSALVKKLLLNNFNVIGIDNLNDYYDPALKRSRIDEIKKLSISSEGDWQFYKISIEDEKEIEDIFSKFNPSIVYNLAAQAGVRYSLQNPKSYLYSNLIGFANILECCRKFKVNNFIYASSSSVYGGNKKVPFSEEDNVDHPVSFYAATKKCNEILAHSYSHLYNIPSIGLRFFTVYGPWGRPDMAPMIFTNAIIKKIPINVYNFGNLFRDFTYIDDVVEALLKFIDKPALCSDNFDFKNPNAADSFAPHKIFNIGNSKPIPIMNFISELEKTLEFKAKINFEPMQLGDVEKTFADTSKLYDWIGYEPSTSLNVGIKRFVNWYKNFYIEK